ncbi:hypothetical protein CKO11_04640 [Rhodobacter sp. TJ_12]|uniref:hypothetical protein n=1 Tax=Rhodobacter sp. TJ_12 TaxID=2029399 RepID=UPI001CC06E50|nr:hypothetical protein [Rhodobacter sp. TJ_12]MBZ4021746.1 hypothetical protein [Rhodobacter sp. TJ_12]
MADFDDVYSKNATTESIRLGDGAASGYLSLNKAVDVDGRGQRLQDVPVITLSANTGELKVGEPQGGILGTINMRNVTIDAKTATFEAGGNSGRGDGKLNLFNRLGRMAMELDAKTGIAAIGAERSAGTLILRDGEGVETARLTGAHGNLTLGGGSADGDLTLKTTTGHNAFTFNGQGANMTVGTTGADGNITVKSSANEAAIVMNGNAAQIIVGGVGTNGDIVMRNNLNEDTLLINGSAGDIQFLNADFAEEFTVQEDALAVALPGTVMAMDDEGLLVPATQAYDTAVIGVVAGGGRYKPALVLDRQGGAARKSIAMVGKVMVQLSAHNGAIRPGDLLTSSEITGVAMKVTDRDRALGAVIGKAMGRLDAGTDLVPVLVNLQ